MKITEEEAQVEFEMEKYGACVEAEGEEEYATQSILEEHAAMELVERAQSYLGEFCIGVDFEDYHNVEVLIFCSFLLHSKSVSLPFFNDIPPVTCK
jgi:hypothetical protein